MITYRLILSGKVQNVGCRHTFSKVAKQLDLTGYVKNLSSGEVELVVQGKTVDIQSLLNEAQEKNSRLEFSSSKVEMIQSHLFSSFEII
jgi:acylphosphatase